MLDRRSFLEVFAALAATAALPSSALASLDPARLAILVTVTSPHQSEALHFCDASEPMTIKGRTYAPFGMELITEHGACTEPALFFSMPNLPGLGPFLAAAYAKIEIVSVDPKEATVLATWDDFRLTPHSWTPEEVRVVVMAPPCWGKVEAFPTQPKINKLPGLHQYSPGVRFISER